MTSKLGFKLASSSHHGSGFPGQVYLKTVCAGAEWLMLGGELVSWEGCMWGVGLHN